MKKRKISDEYFLSISGENGKLLWDQKTPTERKIWIENFDRCLAENKRGLKKWILKLSWGGSLDWVESKIKPQIVGWWLINEKHQKEAQQEGWSENVKKYGSEWGWKLRDWVENPNWDAASIDKGLETLWGQDEKISGLSRSTYSIWELIMITKVRGDKALELMSDIPFFRQYSRKSLELKKGLGDQNLKEEEKCIIKQIGSLEELAVYERMYAQKVFNKEEWGHYDRWVKWCEIKDEHVEYQEALRGTQENQKGDLKQGDGSHRRL